MTLGDYRDACVAIAGENCKAVKFLDKKIAAQGRDETVLADDSQMWILLTPMLDKPEMRAEIERLTAPPNIVE
jgi:hypothetical protein